MEALKITTQNALVDNMEDGEKNASHSSHSTDTEPEPEIENYSKIYHSVSFIPNDESSQKNAKARNTERKKKEKNAFEEFFEGIPTFEYDQRKIRQNQIMKKNKANNSFYKIEMSNYRFLNYFDAFLNVAEHCQKNNQKFTRENCREYLKDCYIIDFSHDTYIPLTSHLTLKLFNKYFRLAQREKKYF